MCRSARSQTAPPGDGSPGDNRMLPYVPPELRLVISHRFTVRKLVRPIRPERPILNFSRFLALLAAETKGTS